MTSRYRLTLLLLVGLLLLALWWIRAQREPPPAREGPGAVTADAAGLRLADVGDDGKRVVIP